MTVLIPSHLNPGHASVPCFLKIEFNIILPCSLSLLSIHCLSGSITVNMQWKFELHVYPFTVELRYIICSLNYNRHISAVVSCRRFSTFTDVTQLKLSVTMTACNVIKRRPCLRTFNFSCFVIHFTFPVCILELCLAE